MTDDDFDAKMAERLANAGDRWRAVHAEPATMKPDVFAATEPIDIVATSTPPRRRRWNAWTAGISSVAAAAVAVLIAVNIHSGESGKPPVEVGDTGIEALTGDWTLRSLVAADGNLVPPPSAATLKFADGKIGGTDGCNYLGGQVTIGATSFDVGQGLATTDMACIDRPAGFDAEVALIHDVLTGTVHWSVTNDLLTLVGPSGAKLVYARVDASTSTDPRALVGSWQLETVGEGGLDGSASSSSDYASVRFEFNANGTFRGWDGCNAFEGNYQASSGGQLIAHTTGSTLRACGNSDPASRFHDGEMTWQVANGQLRITKPSVGYLEFVPVAPEQPTSSGVNGSATASSGSSGGGSSSGSTGEPAASASDLPLHS